VDIISAEQLRDSHAESAIRLQSLCHHLQLLSARPECRTLDGRVVRAVRRVFRTSPEQPRFQFDWQRTGRLAAFGGAIAGPLGHVWFQALDANIMPATPRRCMPRPQNLGLETLSLQRRTLSPLPMAPVHGSLHA
jgi:hypothetical protein